MCHSHRSALFNLLFEQRNHTAVTPQHISKPHRDKLCL